MWVLFFGEINVVYYFITSLLKNCCSPLSFQASQESFILLFHLHFVFLLLHPCTQPKIKGIVSFVKLENFRHSFFILSFQPPIWYSFKLLSLPKTWDKADKDRNDRTIYNAEIFLVSIVFVDYWLSIGITIHVLLVYFSFLPPTRLLLLLLWLAIIIIIITIDVYFYLLTFLT